MDIRIIRGIVLSVIVLMGAGFCISGLMLLEEPEPQPEVTFDHTAYIEIDEYYPDSLRDWELPTPYWLKEGYPNLKDWWEDLQEIKKENENIAAPAIEKWGAYLSEEEKEKLKTIENDIQKSHYVTDCKQLKEQFDEIIEENKPKPKPVSTGSYTTSTANFKRMGIIYANGWRYTWYSQNVLPGGGLRIPGRHVGAGNLIYDGSGYIVVAANRADLGYGATVPTPFGTGKVYDTGCAQGTIDIYTNF